MHIKNFSLGSIRIDSVTYEHDVVIDRGQTRKRRKKSVQEIPRGVWTPPLSTEEEIPWKCRLVVGALPPNLIVSTTQVGIKRCEYPHQSASIYSTSWLKML
ncbi:MAG: hypothetical protein DMG06_25260 [Acidobacteria bacterium]|nr:MAG: hypothetical protein DMG06_25260 [Acidobacteriota bacterium]